MDAEERIRALMEEIAALRAENAALRGGGYSPQKQLAPVFQNMPYTDGMYQGGPEFEGRIATPQRVQPNQYMQALPYKAPAKKRSPFE